jgi:excisionase family DNA binding protein
LNPLGTTVINGVVISELERKLIGCQTYLLISRLVGVNELSVSEAAEQLGVSPIQVGRLIKCGELRAQRFGKAWAVNRQSVVRYANIRSGRGRPLSAGSAWAQLLGAHPRSINEATDLAKQSRRRGVRRDAAIGIGKLPALFADSRIVVSGVVAAANAGAAVDENPPHVVYLKHSDYQSVLSEFRLLADHSAPNVVIWVVNDADWSFDGPIAPPAIALVDLVSEGEHRSARELLKAMDK